MKELVIDVWGKCKYKPIITIDGKRVNFEKRNENRYLVYYSTDKSKVRIAVSRFLEINSRFWLLWELLYFLISLFGLLDFRSERKCMLCDCSFEAELVAPRTNLSVRMSAPRKGSRAAEIRGAALTIEKNEFRVDKKARLRVRLIGLFKLAFWIAAIVIALLFAFGVL